MGGESKWTMIKFPKINHSKDEIQKISGYTLGKKIGEGTHATVRLAWAKPQSAISCLLPVAAVKIVYRPKVSPDFRENFFHRELEILRKLKHENVIRVFSIFDLKENVYIFMRYAEKGDLSEHLLHNGPLQETQAREWFGQMVAGLSYCHDKHIAHRDLKCDNVLITRDNRVLLSDFGLARFWRKNGANSNHLSRTFCGSPAYAAPEIIASKPYNPMMADVWSLGVILYYMLCCEIPFDATSLAKMLQQQQQKTWKFHPKGKWNREVKKCILGILEPDVDRRFGLRDIKNSHWLSISRKSKGKVK